MDVITVTPQLKIYIRANEKETRYNVELLRNIDTQTALQNSLPNIFQLF